MAVGKSPTGEQTDPKVRTKIMKVSKILPLAGALAVLFAAATAYAADADKQPGKPEDKAKPPVVQPDPSVPAEPPVIPPEQVDHPGRPVVVPPGKPSGPGRPDFPEPPGWSKMPEDVKAKLVEFKKERDDYLAAQKKLWEDYRKGAITRDELRDQLKEKREAWVQQRKELRDSIREQEMDQVRERLREHRDKVAEDAQKAGNGNRGR